MCYDSKCKKQHSIITKENNMSPYDVGKMDAAQGEVFCPELYYVNRQQKRQYAEGFQAVKACDAAARLLGLAFVSAGDDTGRRHLTASDWTFPVVERTELGEEMYDKATAWMG
jgi:hypothetical protein